MHGAYQYNEEEGSSLSFLLTFFFSSSHHLLIFHVGFVTPCFSCIMAFEPVYVWHGCDDLSIICMYVCMNVCMFFYGCMKCIYV